MEKKSNCETVSIYHAVPNLAATKFDIKLDSRLVTIDEIVVKTIAFRAFTMPAAADNTYLSILRSNMIDGKILGCVFDGICSNSNTKFKVNKINPNSTYQIQILDELGEASDIIGMLFIELELHSYS